MIRLAAIADVFAGGSGMALLTATDPAVSVALQAKAVEAAQLSQDRDKRLARYIGAVLSGKRI